MRMVPSRLATLMGVSVAEFETLNTPLDTNIVPSGGKQAETYTMGFLNLFIICFNLKNIYAQIPTE